MPTATLHIPPRPDWERYLELAGKDKCSVTAWIARAAREKAGLPDPRATAESDPQQEAA